MVSTDWADAPLEAVIDHILAEYHVPLKEMLPRLDRLAREVGHPEVLERFGALKADLELHLQKEEQILFPMIAGGNGTMAGGPISVMEEEHDTARDVLRELRRLTNGYTIPPGATEAQAALWAGLATLERELLAHIHLENEVLHPRALGGT